MIDVDLSRRELLLAAISAGVAPSILSRGVNAQEGSGEDYNRVRSLAGPASARPAPGDLNCNLIYESLNGGRSYIEQDDTEWSTLPTVHTSEVLTSTQTVANTTTETTVFSTDLAATTMEAGRVYELELYGDYETNDGSDFFDLRISLGGQVVSTTRSVPENVSGAPMTIRTRITVRNTGQSGEVVTHTESVFADVHDDTAPTSSITIDTTVANTLAASVEWNVAEAGDEVHIRQGYLKVVS